MPIEKITQPIVNYQVVKTTPSNNIVQMHEKLKRPPTLMGVTYKISPPTSEYSLYVTINDIVLNPDTPQAVRRPFEIFINSKNMDHFQWIVALTRIISAVFRIGGDIVFLVDELRSVFDPRGGYFKKGGKYMPSLVAEIGDVVETHLKSIGMLVATPEPAVMHKESNKNTAEAFPASAEMCNKCYIKAVVRLDGCLTCLSCGDSKCGS